MGHLRAISDYDRYLFHEGRHFRSYRMLGAQIADQGGTKGVRFAVWAPNARAVKVVGDFSGWGGDHHLRRIKASGIWELFVPGLESGVLYKYQIVAADGCVREKADPYAFWAEVRPKSASRIHGLDGYHWGDSLWQGGERQTGSVNKALAIYEVHLGSWRRKGDGSFYNYRELADELSEYVADMGFTHIELMPVAEHPLDASWGYQATGYFAPTSRYGTPDDFKYFVDRCHQSGLGVILDWVPGHFCKDDHGLRMFDGNPTFESGWAVRAENHGWGTLNFDFGKPEVWSFLISNAMYWLDVFHIDGLRVDAVANMIYLDYGRREGSEWLPNEHGGRENLQAIAFLKKLNEVVHYYFPRALVIAEESTAWPLVSRPVYLGGLGFDYKWNMGWMNDTLKYASLDPLHRQWEHKLLTFSLLYAFSENFLLPLSHDEVVHGKKSLLDKMPGDYWQKFANLRAFYGYFMSHPGKKLLFMGGEFGQFSEWYEGRGLDWMLLDYDLHAKLLAYTRDLVRYYRRDACLWQNDDNWRGFEWIDCNDRSQSVVSFLRRADDGGFTAVIANFTPVVRYGYRIGVPQAGSYREVFNSDRQEYGGSGVENGELVAEALPWHNQPFSVMLTVPPLAAVYLKLDTTSEE
jgi:1,4-alpha-glucan branching enzyme